MPQNNMEIFLQNEDLFGCEAKDPLIDAFPLKNGSHSKVSMTKVPPEKFEQCWQEAIAKPGEAEKRVIYIHIPFCLLHCTYCVFFKNFKDIQRQEQYIHHLLTEIRMAKQYPYLQNKPISAIYFGGGTPGILDPKHIRDILSALRDYTPLAEDCEITFETSLCDLDDHKLQACLDGGVNRFSFGVQTFNTEIRRSMGRPDDKETLLERLNQLGKIQNQAALIIDLIYGFPNQTMEIWQEDISLAIQSSIHGLDVYSLNIYPDSMLAQSIEKGTLPPGASHQMQAEMYAKASFMLEKAGMRRLSVCHWGRFDLKERNRYNYINKAGAGTIPFGAGAGGNIDGTRFRLESDLDRYEEKVRQGLKPILSSSTPSEHHFLLSKVRADLDRGFLDISELEREFQLPLKEHLAPLFDLWERRGFVSQSFERVEMTLAGRYWYPKIIQGTISYLEKSLSENLMPQK